MMAEVIVEGVNGLMHIGRYSLVQRTGRSRTRNVGAWGSRGIRHVLHNHMRLVYAGAVAVIRVSMCG